MAGRTYDEAIDALREEYDLDLSNVFDEEDLKAEFGKLSATQREDARKTLVDNAYEFVYGKDAKRVQEEIESNFDRVIKESNDADSLLNVPKISSELDKKDDIQLEYDKKSIELVEKAVKIDKSYENLADRVSNKNEFLSTVALKERGLLAENIDKMSLQEIKQTGLRSVRKLSNEIGLSKEATEQLLADKGAKINSNGTFS